MQGDHGPMLTTDAIEYDMEKLGAMTQAQLLIQLCVRHDRLTPGREPRMKAKAYALEIAAAIEKVVNNLPPVLAPLKAEVQQSLAEFQEVIA